MGDELNFDQMSDSDLYALAKSSGALDGASPEDRAKLEKVFNFATITPTPEPVDLSGSVMSRPPEDTSGAIESSGLSDIFSDMFLGDVGYVSQGTAGRVTKPLTSQLPSPYDKLAQLGIRAGSALFASKEAGDVIAPDRGAINNMLPGVMGPGGAMGFAELAKSPLGKVVGKKVAGYGTKTGERRFAELGTDLERAESIDPGRKKLVQALQPNMSEFDDASKVGIQQRLKEAQDSGYLNDTATPEDLINKLRDDLGGMTTEPEYLPNGERVMRDVADDGRLGKKVGAALDELMLKEKAPAGSVTAPIKVEAPENLLEQELARGAVKFAKRVEGHIPPDEVQSYFVSKIPEIKRALGDNPTLERVVQIRRNYDALVDKSFQKPFSETTIQDDVNEAIANALRSIEDQKARALDPDAYSRYRLAKREFQVAKDLQRSVWRANARITKNITGGTATRPPTLDLSTLRGKAWNAIFPAQTPERLFSQSQIASKLRGNDVTAPINLGDAGAMERLKNVALGAPGAVTQAVGPYAGRQALNVAGTEGLRRVGEVIAPQDANAMEPTPQLPSLDPQTDLKQRAMQYMQNGLPRDTQSFMEDNVALGAFVDKIKGTPKEGIGIQLGKKLADAVKAKDSQKTQRIIADMAKLFPEVFEEGLGVDNKLFHPDDQRDYVNMLWSAQRKGVVKANFIAKQRDAFLDPNDSQIIPFEPSEKHMVDLGEYAKPTQSRPVDLNGGASARRYRY